MGIYLNPGTDKLDISRNSRLYVDKSQMISFLNSLIDTEERFVCVSRPRRFGKTMAANMLTAYYSKDCDSHASFSGLSITADPSFERYLNKYNVIKIDINGAISNKGTLSVSKYYEREILPELREKFRDVELPENITLANAITRIHSYTHEKFVIIIDEYDVIMRDEAFSKDLDDYLMFLVSLFKDEVTNTAIALAYITGILPVIREKAQSKLNNFTEYTMLDGGELSPYMGFVWDEVKELALSNGMDSEDLRSWYDGYKICGIDVFSPKSVVTAIIKKKCGNYWSQTGTYESIIDYIRMDFEGIKDDVVRMIAGESIPFDPSTYRNSLNDIKSKDDVFASLIHLGYLSYDSKTEGCFIPNKEIRTEWIKAIKLNPDYKNVLSRVNMSRELLEATWNMDCDKVSQALFESHGYVTSNLTYNNEGSFQSAIRLAYFYSDAYYTVINELPTGKGFADVVFIPFVPNVPAMIVELKKDSTPDIAINQIKEREYPKALEKYRKNLLLVAISYETSTKNHYCKIEKAQ